MTQTAELSPTTTIDLEPARMVEGARMVMRAVHRTTGAALALAAVGIWLAPGSSWDTDLMLFKLVLSIVALFVGVGLMQSSTRPSRQPVVEIDTIRREVRLVRPQGQGRGEVLKACAFKDLSRAERIGNHVRLFAADKSLLAEVTLSKRSVLNSVVGGLQDAGKLS